MSEDGKKKKGNVRAKGGVDPRSNKSKLSADGKKKRAAKDPV